MTIRAGRAVETARVYYLVCLVSLLWFMVQFVRFVFPPLFETFQSIYGVSNTATGLLFTLLMLSYAAVQFPAGVLGDRLGLATVILGGAIVFSVATLFTAFSPSFIAIVVAAMLIGVGTGPHKTVSIPLLSRRYPDHPGRVLGVMDTVGQFGGMVAPVVVVLLLGAFVWQSVFIFGAGVSVVLATLFYWEMRTKPALRTSGSDQPVETPDGTKNVSYRTTFANRRLLTFVFVTICYTFAWNGLASFLPLFLTVEKELSTGFAGVLYSLLFAMSVSQAVTGELSDRVGKLTVAVGLFITMAAGIGLLLASGTAIAIGLAIVVTGLGFHGFRPVRDSYLMEIIPAGVGGGVLGAIRTVMTGVGALAPATIGLLSDLVGFVAAFTMIGAAATLAALLTLFLQ